MMLLFDKFGLSLCSILLTANTCEAIINPWRSFRDSFKLLQESILMRSYDYARPHPGVEMVCRNKVFDTSTFRFIDENFRFHLKNIRDIARIRRKRKLALFIHGWNDDGSLRWTRELFVTWLHFKPDHSVCVVDWSNLSKTDYRTATMTVYDVGLTIALFLELLEIINPDFSRKHVTLVGYSLGAHVAGFTGYLMNGEVGHIIGLDPAGPLFTFPAITSSKYRLDETDAVYVQVLHTSDESLGPGIKCGHADFYPNGGIATQKNCLFNSLTNRRDLLQNSIVCSHISSAIFFKESLNPSLVFWGQRCNSFRDFSRGLCHNNSLSRFGIYARNKSKGNFYFNTLPQQPYVVPLPDIIL